MLARNYKTHTELGITEREYHALLVVQEKLRTGEIAANNFNMGHFSSEMPCGTVACIGGWMANEMQENAYTYVSRHSYFQIATPMPESLRALFYPKYEYRRITTEMAVQAIENVLTTGDANWAGVVAR